MFKKSLEPWHLQANRHCKMEMETPLCTCNCTYLYIRQPQQSINLRFHLGKLKTDLAVRILKTLLKLLKMPTAQLFASWRVGQHTRELGCEGHFRKGALHGAHTWAEPRPALQFPPPEQHTWCKRGSPGCCKAWRQFSLRSFYLLIL